MLATKQFYIYDYSLFPRIKFSNISILCSQKYIISCMTLFDNNTDHAE